MKTEILPLFELLQHATKVLRCGRIFVAQVYATTAKVKELHFLTRLNKEFQSDIAWWYMMNLRILSLYVPIDLRFNSPTEKLLTYSCMLYLIPYCLVCYHLEWKMDPLLAIEYPLISSRLACQLVGSQ